MNEIIICIDPGREKCGMAVVHRENGVLTKAVIATKRLSLVVEEWMMEYQTEKVVIGDGTSSREAKEALEKIKLNGKTLNIIFIDEYRSTDEARKRYWQENPPRGLRRLIPVTMQVPPEPVDDYVAIILAERYFADTESSRAGG
jgi:RNase H-fold protein (predicted Holliday junction resolvase)